MFASARANGRPGLGSSATISACASRSSVLVGAGHGHQLLQVAPREQRQVALADDDRDRLRLAARLGAQLQRQALGQVARADAGRLHALQPAQRAAQAGEQLVASARRRVLVDARRGRLRQPRGDLLQRVGQVAVVVERLDQHHAPRRASAARRRMPESWPRRWSCRLCVARVAVAVVESSPSLLRARLARRLADAVEVLALGAVLPVLALGGAELGRAVDRRHARRRRRRRRSSAARSASRSPARSALVSRSASGSNAGAASSSASRNGFCSSICSTSWCSSSVDSCSSRIDCCSCGVSARCCDRRTCRDGFMRSGERLARLTSGSARRGRPCGRRRCRRSRPACLRPAPGPR